MSRKIGLLKREAAETTYEIARNAYKLIIEFERNSPRPARIEKLTNEIAVYKNRLKICKEQLAELEAEEQK